jgi:type II secretory pathway predicted ATPase ExeA
MVTLDDRTVVSRLRQLGLLENPFLSYPDARYFVPCVEHSALYQEVLQLCVDDRMNRLALVRGEEGTGKTTLTQRVSETVFPGGTISLRSVLMTEEIPTPTSLVRAINDYFLLETKRSLEDRLDVLRQFILSLQEQGSGLLIIVDQKLNSQVWSTLLEILRWKEAGELLHIQAAVFSRNNLFKYEESKKDLSDFVGVRRTLGNLSFASASKILETLPKMAGRSAPLFQTSAASEIVEISGGHPGNMIDLAGHSFDLLLDSNESSISLQMVMEAKKEV